MTKKPVTYEELTEQLAEAMHEVQQWIRAWEEQRNAIGKLALENASLVAQRHELTEECDAYRASLKGITSPAEFSRDLIRQEAQLVLSKYEVRNE